MMGREIVAYVLFATMVAVMAMDCFLVVELGRTYRSLQAFHLRAVACEVAHKDWKP